MNVLYEEFKGRGFTLLLVNMGEDPPLVRQAVVGGRHSHCAPSTARASHQASSGPGPPSAFSHPN